jgi:hypothetical protein
MKYGECTWKVEKSEKDTCDKQCGNQTTILNSVAGMTPPKSGAPDMSDITKGIGKMCTLVRFFK